MMTLHFVNVGKGSCTIVEHESTHISIVDIDDSSTITAADLLAEGWTPTQIRDALSVYGRAGFRTLYESRQNTKLTDPVEYLSGLRQGAKPFRFILTHPHRDHVAGLARLAQSHLPLNFWDTNNAFEPDDPQTPDWEQYKVWQNSAASPKRLCLHRGDTGDYWTADGVTILSPTPQLEQSAKEGDLHDLCYVLRFEHGGYSTIVCGDVSVAAQENIVAGVDPQFLQATVLLAPHHGSENNYSESFVNAVRPDLIVVSVAAGVNYARAQYEKHADTLSTKYWGNVVVTFSDRATYSTEYDRAA